MGNIFSTILNSISSLFGNKEVRILILGLDGAGKTTILYRLVTDEFVAPTLPTIGFNLETVKYKNINLQVWDLGGQKSIRPYWRCYYGNTDAVVFVIDASHVDRFSAGKEELHLLLEEEELRNAPLLILANKQDLPHASTVADLTKVLNLTAIRERKWTIIPTSALKGTGVKEGFDWLANELTSSTSS